MGDFQLGALMGRNQSLENFNGLPEFWSRSTNQASFYQVDCMTMVHSSTFGLKTFADSTGSSADILSFQYGNLTDLYRVWFPEVTTHALISSVWARAGDAPSSGQIRWRLFGASEALSQPIAFTPSLLRYEVETTVESQGGVPFVSLTRLTAANSRATLYIDDVMTLVDPLLLHPEWGAREKQRLTRVLHRNQQGISSTYAWNAYFEFQLPIRWLTDSHAELINWWWQEQLDLALTLDTSDDTTRFPCRIINPRQPVGRRERPYQNQWMGRLELAGINQGGLVF